jgi:hypothetical protein
MDVMPPMPFFTGATAAYRVLQKCYIHVTGVLEGGHRCVTKMLTDKSQKCCKDVTRVLHKGWSVGSDIRGMLQGCYSNAQV